MTACLSHSIGFCDTFFHAVQVLALQRPKRSLCSCSNPFCEISDPYLSSTEWRAPSDLKRCGNLLQFVDGSSGGAPKDWPSQMWVPSNLGCGCIPSSCFLLCGINHSCLFVLFQWAILCAGTEGWRCKGKIEGVLPEITLQLSPIYKVPDMSLSFRLQPQAFSRAAITSVGASKRKVPHALWAAETHFPFLFF